MSNGTKNRNYPQSKPAPVGGKQDLKSQEIKQSQVMRKPAGNKLHR